MAAMKNLELIVPFCIPPAGLEKDLLKAMQTPSLAKLIAASSPSMRLVTDEFSNALAHEYLIADEGEQIDFSTSPTRTWNVMQGFQLAPQEGCWFTLQPVHIHLARDHLVLMDQRQLRLTEVESRQLFAIAKNACDEFQLELIYGDLNTWFLRADAWSELKTATVDATCGHNIEIWMARGEQARAWRKLQNEIQMLWFDHPINLERDIHGLSTVNSVWLSCGSSKPLKHPKSMTTHHNAKELLTKVSSNQNCAALVDILVGSAMNSDWAYWLENIHRLEHEWISPLLDAVKQKQIDQLSLICTDARQVWQFNITPWALRKFWIKPSLSKLFSIKAQ